MDKLRIKNVSKTYQDRLVLQGVNFTLQDGELVCLLGASGAGKTTLFHVISGICTPDQGQVFLEDKEITGVPGNVSYMLQKDLLLPHMTIADNAALPLLIQKVGKKEARRQATAHLKTFGLEGTEDQYPHQLSGGMRQRAALLRTYLFSKEVTLLDEPFSALDAMTRRSMQQWFLDLRKQIPMSAMIITHDIEEALLLADRILVLGGKPGHIVKEIPLSQVKKNEENFEFSKKFQELKMELLREFEL